MYIGTNASTGFIEISDAARKSNIAVFGIKSTGKAFTLIPSLLNQDLKDTTKGATIIVDTPELAWYLYGMCKVAKRKVDLLKPSINFDFMNKLMFMKKWDYDEIKEVYDFETAIKQKRITIIDAEEERYGNKAIRVNTMMLLELQAAMVVERNKKANYSVYIDSAGDYLSVIENLLKYGDYYGFDSTLLFRSREELKDNAVLVDNYVRNYILLQGICYEDAKYFGERMNTLKSVTDSVRALLNREYGIITYEILKGNGFVREIGEGTLIEFTDREKKEFRTEGNKFKKKCKENKLADNHYQLEEEAESIAISKDTTMLKEVDVDRKLPDGLVVQMLGEQEAFEETEVSEKKSNPNRLEMRDDFKKDPKVEPQLNKNIKTSTFKEEPVEVDYSDLDTIDMPSFDEDPILEEIEDFSEVEMPKEIVDDELENFELPDEIEELKEPVPKKEFDLGNKTFSIGSKYQPYKKIHNKKIEKSLSGFKM